MVKTKARSKEGNNNDGYCETDDLNLIKQAFMGMLFDGNERKIQSVMYYTYDIGRLGMINDGDLIKCFKNEVSYTMKLIYKHFVSRNECKTYGEAVDLFVMMSEVFVKRLIDLSVYMFNDESKRVFFVNRVQQYIETITDMLRQKQLRLITKQDS